MEYLKIGVLVSCLNAKKILPQIIPYGFESVSLTFDQTIGGINLSETAKALKEMLDEKNITISTLSIYGNPLLGNGTNKDALESWRELIDNAHHFGTDLVTGFTGRIPGRPIEESIPRFSEVFGELGRRASDKGVRLAFENCPMLGNWQAGDWNIAHNPDAWEILFNEVPYDNLGLEWEPCHQMMALIDPIPQLRRWVNKIFHIHGKDANIAWDIIKEYGIYGKRQFAWNRTPGFGDSNWSEIITILLQNGYTGAIDIEGYHDPVYKDELEMTGQVYALNYLKKCRKEVHRYKGGA